MNNRIRKVTPAGVITTVVGTGSAGYSGDGGPAASAQLKFPADVVVDGAGNLFIADVGNSRVRKVSSASGTITTVAGNGTSGFSGDGGPATLAALTSPAGVDLDSAGELFIADYGANRVRRVSAGGVITTVAGTGSPGYSGDGGPATAAMLKSPADLAVSQGVPLQWTIQKEEKNVLNKNGIRAGKTSTIEKALVVVGSMGGIKKVIEKHISRCADLF